MSTHHVSPDDLNNLGKMFGSVDPLKGMTGDDIAKLLDLPSTEAPAPNISAVDGWPTLAKPALYGLAGDVVRAIEPHSEADPVAILLQFLVAFGNVIGPGAYCIVESTRHLLNLFAVLVGESSKARKGTSWNHIKRIFTGVDFDWITNRVTGGLSSAEGLINEVKDQEPAIDRRLLAISGEFASVLKVMSREGNNLSSTLRDAWDGGNLRTLVKADPLRATGAHISMVGHITRPELLKYLNETESHNGFANRLCWTCVKRSKFLPEGGFVPEGEMTVLSLAVREAVEWAREEREYRRDNAARQLWAAVYPHLSEGQPGLLGAATSRAEAQVLRLSAIYAALDKSQSIHVEHLSAALAVWDYCYGSARFIFGDATGDVIADRIRAELDAAGEDGMSRTEISNIFKRNVSGERLDQALKQLESLGVASRRMVPSNGRSVEIWATK